MPDPELDAEQCPDLEEADAIGDKWHSVLKDTCKGCFAVIGSPDCVCVKEVDTETEADVIA